jgi:hypothetical protein
MRRKKELKSKRTTENRKSANGLGRVHYVFVGALAVAISLFFLIGGHSQRSTTGSSANQAQIKMEGPVTFSKEIAPIVFKNCTPCHRPGESGPFDLLSYADVKKHARDIASVTARRIMPPWLPEPGYGEFESDRRLADRDLSLLQKWIEDGSPEGNPAETPQLPKWNEGWSLGTPDLVVETAPYTLPAGGNDIYYNFVVPIPTASTRYVSGVEFIPGNRVVHHAFINIDPTRGSKRRAAKLDPPGFLGMDLPETAVMPGGQLTGWQPGKIPRLATQGLAWTLRTNTDLVLQVHMNPSGKPEKIQPKVGFYFTDQAPTNAAFRIQLAALELDIPAGESNYVAERSYTLPVDVSMVRVGAHAHYLAKEMQGYAILPGGEKKWLLWIKSWDFKWQGDYQYKEPVFLPKGSKLTMRFSYDNSTNNVRNPFNPPHRILWGLQTTDEMGALYFQAMPKNQQDYQTLGLDHTRFYAKVSMDYYRFRLEKNPADADAQQRMGRALASTGETEEAISHLTEAIRLDPNNDLAHFDLGSIYLRQKRAQEAYQEFQEVIRLNPDDSQAFGSLGIICLQAGRLEEGRDYLVSALRLNPEDALAAQYLQRLNMKLR